MQRDRKMQKQDEKKERTGEGRAKLHRSIRQEGKMRGGTSSRDFKSVIFISSS